MAKVAGPVLLIVLAGCTGQAPAVRAAGPVGVCTAPDVIATVVGELRRQGVDGTVDARSPGEVTTPGNPVTSCAVWLLQPERNTNDPPGSQTRYRVAVQGFQVRRLAHSLVVDLTGTSAWNALGPQAGPGGPYPGPGRLP